MPRYDNAATPDLQRPRALADAAIALETYVFPCKSNKKPVTTNGFKNATKDPGEIRKLFARETAAFIGMPTGGDWTGVFVLDVDDKEGRRGNEWLDTKPVLPRTRTVRTQSGGRHFYFNWPGQKVKCSNDEHGPGIDVRGDGGYVIVPPSAGYEVVDDAAIADAPAWLVALMCPPPPAPRPAAAPRATPTVGNTAYGLKALKAECDTLRRAKPGTQESTLNACCLKVGGLVAGGELLEGYALEALIDACHAMESQPGRNLAKDEEHVGRSFRDGMKNPRSAPAVKPGRITVKPAAKTGKPVGGNIVRIDFTGVTKPNVEPAPVADLATYLSAEAWMEREFPPSVRLLGDLVTTTSRMFLVGATGLGKTMLGVALAAGMATGTGFLDWPCDRPSRVLYVDGEMPGELVKVRLADAMRRLGRKDLSSNLLVYCSDTAEDFATQFPALGVLQPLSTEEGHNFIYGLVEALKVDVVIFDNVMSLVGGDQKDEIPWTETLPLVTGLTRRRVGQIWLDHTGHNTARQYGTSTKAWRFDSVGVMTAHDGCGERETAFKLSFDTPGKARRRTPDNWDQFAPRVIRLTDDVWSCDGAANDTGGFKHLRNSRAKYYEPLMTAIAASGMPGKATAVAWEQACVNAGLIQPGVEASYKLFRTAKSEMLRAEWISTDGVYVRDLKRDYTS